MSITLILIIFTGLVSWQALNNSTLFHNLKHFPYGERRDRQYYRMLSSGFVHGDMMHLLLNMYVLYMFGEIIEGYFVQSHGATIGRLLYFLSYIGMIILADIPSFISKANNPGYASVGASGATSGIIMMFVMVNPWSILLLFFVIPVPAIVLGIGYLIYSSWASRNSSDNIDHSAHFWGALAGVIIWILLIPNSIPMFLDRVQQLPL